MDRLHPVEVAFLLCFIAVPIWGILDAVRIPTRAWQEAGRSKRLWILIQLALLYIGTVAYVSGVRRDVLFFTAPPAKDWEQT
ncbi:MAG: hypothetical protein ACT4OM_01045 [Actinomycetota bacterium]